MVPCSKRGQGAQRVMGTGNCDGRYKEAVGFNDKVIPRLLVHSKEGHHGDGDEPKHSLPGATQQLLLD